MAKAAVRKMRHAVAKKSAKRKKKTRELQPVKPAARKPRQARLPEMDDPAIDGLNALAEDYAAIRDKRMGLTKAEKGLKEQILTAMHTNHKTSYNFQGVSIQVVAENEKVKVKVRKENGEDEDGEEESDEEESGEEESGEEESEPS